MFRAEHSLRQKVDTPMAQSNQLDRHGQLAEKGRLLTGPARYSLQGICRNGHCQIKTADTSRARPAAELRLIDLTTPHAK
jgi:hypothetical protein